MIDPLENVLVDAQSYDVRRIAAIYADSLGMRWWTKAWFNGRDIGERSQEISRDMAVKFVQGTISKDDWLMRYFPKQMAACRKAVEQARNQILGY